MGKTIVPGFFQNVADGMKFLVKEHMVPQRADRLIFEVSPFLIVSSTLLILGMIPLSSGIYATNPDLSILYAIAIFGIAPIGVFFAGWSSNNKYTLIGGIRSAAQLTAYEIPLLLTLLSVAILSGTFNIIESIHFQHSAGSWNIFLMPLGAALFFITMIAEVGACRSTCPRLKPNLLKAGGRNTAVCDSACCSWPNTSAPTLPVSSSRTSSLADGTCPSTGPCIAAGGRASGSSRFRAPSSPWSSRGWSSSSSSFGHASHSLVSEPTKFSNSAGACSCRCPCCKSYWHLPTACTCSTRTACRRRTTCWRHGVGCFRYPLPRARAHHGLLAAGLLHLHNDEDKSVNQERMFHVHTDKPAGTVTPGQE